VRESEEEGTIKTLIVICRSNCNRRKECRRIKRKQVI